jgi:hypothetical protein
VGRPLHHHFPSPSSPIPQTRGAGGGRMVSSCSTEAAPQTAAHGRWEWDVSVIGVRQHLNYCTARVPPMGHLHHGANLTCIHHTLGAEVGLSCSTNGSRSNLPPLPPGHNRQPATQVLSVSIPLPSRSRS